MAEAAFATVGGVKVCHQVKFCLYHRYKDHLRDTLARFNGEAVLTAVPDGPSVDPDSQDQAHQVTQHNAVLMAQARTRQDHRCQRRVSNVNRQAGRNRVVAPGASSTASSRQARRSRPAEPEVA
jgi:hypothetical protein